ncbi:MAG: uroporphyrinogen-III synthase [Alloprevotella sp.]
MIKKILVSQPAPTNEKSPYYELAARSGLEFTFKPFIRVEGISLREFRDQRVNVLDHTAIVFNSLNAIDHFFSLCKDLRITLPEDMKYFGISEKIVLYIQKYVQYRKRKVFFGTTGRWPDLISVMTRHKTEKYLIPLSDAHNDEVKSMLEQKKLNHTLCTMYRTVPTDFDPEEYKQYDMILLFTPSGVNSLKQNFPHFEQGNIRLACFGEATAKAMEEAGLRVDMKGTGSITGSLEQYLRENP